MNHQSILTNVTAIFLSLFVTMPVLSCISKSIPQKPTIPTYFVGIDMAHSYSTDLWNVDDDTICSVGLYNWLKDNGWVKKYISFDEFDYIFVLTKQICTMHDNVDPSLALAMIAVESRFDKDASSSYGAKGLMQLMPIYHTTRMEQFVEEGHEVDLDDFYSQRLNIAAGVDYIDELTTMTKGDISYALMCYNQGVSTAGKNYAAGNVSYYARQVLSLQEEIKTFLQ